MLLQNPEFVNFRFIFNYNKRKSARVFVFLLRDLILGSIYVGAQRVVAVIGKVSNPRQSLVATLLDYLQIAHLYTRNLLI